MSHNGGTVAVLGTGIMGAAMARNIAKAGYDVRAWNRTHAKAEALRPDGITVAGSPGEAVDGAAVVVTMLHDGDAVLSVLREAAGRLAEGTVWIQSTTVGLAPFAALAEFASEHGLVLYDAPVLGTREPAEAGALTVLAAGTEQEREVVRPLFDAVGATTIWTGTDAAAASATRLKLVANSWVLAVTNAASETMALAAGLDVDPQDFLDAIDGGPLDMGYLRVKASLVLEDRLSPPSFAARTAAKDARLITEAASTAGVRLDGMEASEARLRRATEAGHGDEDMAASYHASFER